MAVSVGIGNCEIIDQGGYKMFAEPCEKIASVMTGFHQNWGIAGGWAIDLFIGQETRNHSDIEIAVFRKDQVDVKQYLKNWTFHKVVKGERQFWGDEFLERPIHELHAIREADQQLVEILLNETDDEQWLFRRDKSISLPLDKVWFSSKEGMPYLNPVIVLLYKVRGTREKDHQDFHQVIGHLHTSDRQWLKAAIEQHEPEHEWLSYL